METELLRSVETEAQISTYIQQTYLKQRKAQKQSGCRINISDDIFWIAKLVSQKCTNPVIILKSLGILFFGKTAAFNLSVLPSQLVCCRNLTLSALHDEGWKEVKEDQDTDVASIIGANEVKNWVVMNIPAQCEKITTLLTEVPELIASEASFRLDYVPNEILIGPGLPPQDVLTEPHFPLVSIQYERVLDTKSIADFSRLEEVVSQKNLVMAHCGSITIGYSPN